MLSDRFIRNAKPGMYADEGGLYLQVYATGKKAFLLRSQVGGKQTKRVLGHYPTMGLAEARDNAERCKSGKDSKTLQDAFDSYYAHLITQFRDPAQPKRMIEKDIMPTLGAKYVDELTRQDFTCLLQHVVDRGSPVMANRLLVQTNRFLSFCEQRGWVEGNPLARVSQRAIGGREQARNRVLSWEEIADLITFVFDTSNKLHAGTRWTIPRRWNTTTT